MKLVLILIILFISLLPLIINAEEIHTVSFVVEAKNIQIFKQLGRNGNIYIRQSSELLGTIDIFPENWWGLEIDSADIEMKSIDQEPIYFEKVSSSAIRLVNNGEKIDTLLNATIKKRWFAPITSIIISAKEVKKAYGKQIEKQMMEIVKQQVVGNKRVEVTSNLQLTDLNCRAIATGLLSCEQNIDMSVQYEQITGTVK